MVSSAANLAAQLDVARLPGNGGLVIRGTAADRNLERFQLDYASQAEPGTWRPIGAALDTPVLDDVLTIWVPPGPGTYVLRLSVSDRAGHAAVRTRVVSWDRVPLLANFTQSDYFLSPDGNGVKDAVLFRYTVLSPTRVDVRVVGPEPVGPGEPTAREVWRTAFEHATYGPASFSWEGRDASGAVVPDGRYTVFINELPFRVEVDSTPPEIGLRFENLQAAGGRVSVSEVTVVRADCGGAARILPSAFQRRRRPGLARGRRSARPMGLPGEGKWTLSPSSCRRPTPPARPFSTGAAPACGARTAAPPTVASCSSCSTTSGPRA